ncbi:MAG TPA: YihY/virulence factor BrkB family protein [Candidatus Dormibacteraeota bacterium]|nr:YihY/virulence factor BrkB family protein [Candidatus Dormibacteraeota bacterium]
MGWLRERAAAVLGQPFVAAALRVLDRYNAAAGGLLAAGLAYTALFAIVPGVVLLAGVVGLLYPDPIEQAKVVALVGGVLPPMRDLIQAILDEAAKGAGPVSIIGAVVLVWGTSRFVVSFQDALARVMGGDRRRGFLASNLSALAAVVLMIGAIVATSLLGGALDFIQAGVQAGAFRVLGDLVSLALGLLPIFVTIVAVIAVYRVVPIPRPPWRATVAPGAIVGLVLSALARVFVFVAPRLIGAAAFLGTLATVFAALAWLALSFQALLFGAAWVRDRATRITPSGAKSLEP